MASFLPGLARTDGCMQAIVLAIVLFAATFFVHWIWWRVRLPQRQTKTLLVLFLAALPIGLAVSFFVPGIREFAPRDFWDVVLVAQFHLACSLSYACINSALQLDSPSLMVVTFIALGGAKGRNATELRGLLDDDLMIRPRLA